MAVKGNPKPLSHLVQYPFLFVPYYAFGVVYATLFLITGLALALHLKETTSTHCRVSNVFPTISAMIGGVTPERYIWRIGIALASSPMMLEVVIFYNFFSKTISTSLWKWMNILHSFLLASENLCLLGLTFISSTENFIIHRNSFIGFIVCSILHMVVFLVMFRTARYPPNETDKISFKIRLALAVCHISLFAVSVYFYWRHNTYCEPYIYSIYGFLEYLIVITNIAFRAALIIDFRKDYYVIITNTSLKSD